MGLSFNEYQQRARGTAEYCVPTLGMYPALGLAGESGEVCEKIKKLHRDMAGHPTTEFRGNLAKELGDVLWYLSAIAGDFGYTLQEIAELNIAKVESRNARGTIHGNGDNR